MKQILAAAAIAAIVATSTFPPTIAVGQSFRQEITAPLLLGSPNLPNKPPLATATTPVDRYGTTGDQLSSPIQITGGTPPYVTRLTGSSVPPLATVTETSLTGTLSAGAFDFSLLVTDSSVPPQSATSTLPWIIDVADPLTIGQVLDRQVTTGTTADFALPAIAGGTPPFLHSVSPSDAGVSVVDGKIRVARSTVGTANFQLTTTDAVGRTRSSNQFAIQTNPAAAVVSHTDDRYISSVLGGTLVGGATNAIPATGGNRAPHSAAVRLDVGHTLTIAYNQVVSAKKYRLGFFGQGAASCNNTTPHFQFGSDQPQFRIETSMDGASWISHVTSMAAWNVGAPICGYSNARAVSFDTPNQEFKFLRVVYTSGANRQGSPMAMNIFEFRASQ